MAVERLHGDAAIQRVEREAHAEAFEFDQVAALVVVGSPVTLTPVDDDLLDLAANQHVLHEGGQRLISCQLRTPVAFLGGRGEDLNNHGRVRRSGAGFLTTGNRQVGKEVIPLREFQPPITGIDQTRRVLQLVAQERAQANAEGRVRIGAARHIEDGLIGSAQAGGRAQHRYHAVQAFILAVRRLIEGEVLLDGHVDAIAHL